ncbi:MAG: HlyD family type I secretion periplasmic adaptor subunit [Acetobacteraceae bacterium]|nr:HlyD family type I secretion periplasmic adaptor subunit [Pseudomonadota bacterium]
MPLLPRPSSKAISPVVADRKDPTLPAILEYQSPSTAIINMPMPLIARNITMTIASMIVALLVLASVVKVDQVVVAQGLVISKAPTLVVQPLETSIVRSIEVSVGDTVHAGQVLARLDPTFATADLGALTAQVSTLQAQASRMQAELENRPFTYSGMDPNLTFQAAVYAQRQSEFNFKMENYRQKAESLASTIQRAKADITNYTDRLQYAKTLEDMRRDLERMNVGSKLNTLAAQDNRAEMQRFLDNARDMANSSQRDLAALIAERNAYVQSWHNDVAEKLTDVLQKLSDAREQLNKAQLRRQLVELRAERDGTVLTIGKVSVGSVLQAGEQFITIVPADAPLEVEANIAGRDDGHVHVGDPVSIKFDTFPYTQYGLAYGVVRLVSANSFNPQEDQRNPTGSVPVSQNSGEVYFRSRITLDRIDLHDTPANFHLVPGMPVTADIRVGRRTLIAAVLNKIVPLATEGMREP